MVWFRAVQPKCTVPLCTWNVRTFKPLNCSALVICLTWRDRGLERLRLIACVQTPIFFFDEEGRGAVCTQAAALTIVKKGIKGLWKKRYHQISQRLCMLCHQLRRLVKIESNTHTKPLLNASGDRFLLIDARESANTLIDNKRRNKSSCRTYLALC